MVHWQQVIELASSIDPALHSEGVSAITLFDQLLEGRYPPELVERVLGFGRVGAAAGDDDVEPVQAPLLAGLDATMRARRRSLEEASLGAARAVLRELPPFFLRLEEGLSDQSMPTGRYALEQVLGRLVGMQPPIESSGSLQCPRCGSHAAHRTYSELDERRFYEARCESCGLFESWFEDDEEADWWDEDASASASVAPIVALRRRPELAWIDIDASDVTLGLTDEQVAALAESSARAARRREEELDYYGDPEILSLYAANPDYLAGLLRRALPLTTRRVEAFSIATEPVTNSAYREFIAATGADAPAGWDFPDADEPNRPAMGISWYEANQFADWYGARLVGEAEWSRAARGEQGYLFPWGDDYGELGAWIDEQEFYVPWMVSEQPRLRSRDGCLGMVSGHWEWCADLFTPYPGADLDALEELFAGASGGGRVRRGGLGRYLVPSAVSRDATQPDRRAEDTVLRLARSR